MLSRRRIKIEIKISRWDEADSYIETWTSQQTRIFNILFACHFHMFRAFFFERFRLAGVQCTCCVANAFYDLKFNVNAASLPGSVSVGERIFMINALFYVWRWTCSILLEFSYCFISGHAKTHLDAVGFLDREHFTIFGGWMCCNGNCHRCWVGFFFVQIIWDSRWDCTMEI